MIRPVLNLSVYESLAQSKHVFGPLCLGEEENTETAIPVSGFCMLQALKWESKKNSRSKTAVLRKSILRPYRWKKKY